MSYRDNDNELLGDQRMKRADAQDFLQLQSNPPLGAGAKVCALLGVTASFLCYTPNSP